MGARFIRLGITGFKSFADATTLDILPGLTGVVGPNGCGKSNVAEALRWAMGEANARHLRGGEMDDLIFAGTANRPSRNVAEVALHMEADTEGLPSPFATQGELQVVRRIERGGGSGYRVNGREARARDVQTLFADLASGSRSAAMVSQGRVGALVNARPDERRAVLEEAAGITGLHARRAEAETRLRAAEGNLERAEARRMLLDTQLAGLRDQARQAERYRTVMEAALEAEATLLAIGLCRAAAARAEAEAMLAAAGHALLRADATADVAGSEAATAQAALQPAREAEAAAAARLERARMLQEVAAAEAARAEVALGAAMAREAQLARDLAHAQSALADLEGADARLVAEAERLAAEAVDAPRAIDAARAEAVQASAALQGADEAAAEAAARAAAAVAEAAGLQHTLDAAEARYRRAQEAQGRLAAEQARVAAQSVPPTELERARGGLTRASQGLIDAGARLEQAEAARHAATALSVRARERHGALDAALHKLRAETRALAEILAVGDGERWPPMVDRLVVPDGLETALGSALGDGLAAADEPGAARHWRILPALPRVPLFGTRLADAVQAPPLLARALDGIGLVASDAEGDAAQAALQPGQCLVSRDGAVWRWDGYTVRAGTPTPASVRLRQRNRLAALQARLVVAEQDAAAAKSEHDTAGRSERDMAAAEQQARLERRAAEAAVEQARSAADGLRTRAEAAQARLGLIEEQMDQLAPEADAAAAAATAARDQWAARPDLAHLQTAAAAARDAVRAARSREAAAVRALDVLERGRAARDARLGSIGRERDDRRMRGLELVGRVADLSARVAEGSAERERLAAVPGRAAEQAHAAAGALLKAEAERDAAVALRQRTEQQAEVAGLAMRSAEHAVFAARERVVRAEGMAEAAIAAGHVAAARVSEREGALPALPRIEDASVAAEERCRGRLQRLVRERDAMGPVNLRAAIEAEAIGGEVAAIIRDRDELAMAIAKLRGSIGHLNREGRERLSAVFQQVDRHFQALFGRMFGGGRAHLAMVGSEDPLLAGLEIYAQPPGKKLAALSLLSGGEQALTALSLVFAVFRCNPAPLCVLDEVDAPLDDANVERFCALLADMVAETGTRFMVVTHHAVTMARMDRLYGVTMQERGVSRLLSVDLSRAVSMVEAVAAE